MNIATTVLITLWLEDSRKGKLDFFRRPLPGRFNYRFIAYWGCYVNAGVELYISEVQINEGQSVNLRTSVTLTKMVGLSLSNEEYLYLNDNIHLRNSHPLRYKRLASSKRH